MQISYLQHRQIDKDKWDHCIRKAPNGNLYAWSWYLDAVCPDWNALIAGDYETVMPLTGRQKWGVHYLFRPMLSQQLGVFSMHPLSDIRISSFLQAIPSRYKLIEIALNKDNQVSLPGFTLSTHKSYQLDLACGYDAVQQNYRQNTVRNIRKSVKNGLSIDPDVSAEKFIHLMQRDPGAGTALLLRKNNLTLLSDLLQALEKHQSRQIIGTTDASGNLIAATLFAESEKVWYYLAPVSTPEGRELGSQFLIIDHFIQKYSGKNYSLDFEGSDIEGIARFYAGFGAKPYTYPFIRKNMLPTWVQFIKRIRS